MDKDLSEKELALLRVLWTKGPAMPVELAVRTLSFPDEIQKPLQTLRQKGLIEVQQVSRGTMGGELITLSAKGRDVLRREGP